MTRTTRSEHGRVVSVYEAKYDALVKAASDLMVLSFIWKETLPEAVQETMTASIQAVRKIVQSDRVL